MKASICDKGKLIQYLSVYICKEEELQLKIEHILHTKITKIEFNVKL